MAKALRYLHQGMTFFDGTAIAAGYYLFQYQAGTTTKANTYTDATKGTANSNPMTLNSDGRLGQDVYIDQSMKFVLASSDAGDPPTSSVFTIDNALASAQVWSTLSKSGDYTILETDRDKLVTVDASSAGVTITLVAAATAGAGFRLSIKKTDSSANAVTVDGNSSETIDGAATYLLYNQYDAIDLVCDGSNWHIQAKELSDVHGASSNKLEIDRSTTITSGNFTLTSGNLTLTSGNATLTSGDLSLAAGSISQIDSDSRTNTVAYPLILDVQTSGTPAANIGTGIEFRAESADETNSPFGRLNFVADDVTGGSEDTHLAVQLRVAGAALADMYKFKNTGGFAYTLTGAPSAARTITLPDSDLTLAITSAASQAEMETASSTTVAVTPGRVKFNPGVAKAWLYYNGSTNSIVSSLNVATVDDDATGDFGVNYSTAFSSNPAVVVMGGGSSGADSTVVVSADTVGTNSVELQVSSNGDSSVNNALTDAAVICVACFGDFT